MVAPNFREEPIRSKKIRQAAAGEQCTLNLPDICCYDPATVVLAHIHDEQFGKGQKADDTSGMFCCWKCHSAYDLHQTGLDAVALLEMALRAYQRTIRRLVRRQIIIIPLDPEHLSSERPAKPRKPPAERAKIPTRETDWPKRPMRSRSNLRKAAP